MIVGNEKSVAMYGIVRASKIIGETVVNRQGENVGKIHELVINANRNRIAYAVLTFGGFLGMGNKLFALPWDVFEFSTTDNKLILDVDKAKLKAAPGFEDGGEWPDFSDTHWGESIYSYYDFIPPWKNDHDCETMLLKSTGSHSCCSTKKEPLAMDV